MRILQKRQPTLLIAENEIYNAAIIDVAPVTLSNIPLSSINKMNRSSGKDETMRPIGDPKYSAWARRNENWEKSGTKELWKRHPKQQLTI